MTRPKSRRLSEAAPVDCGAASGTLRLKDFATKFRAYFVQALWERGQGEIVFVFVDLVSEPPANIQPAWDSIIGSIAGTIVPHPRLCLAH